MNLPLIEDQNALARCPVKNFESGQERSVIPTLDRLRLTHSEHRRVLSELPVFCFKPVSH